MFQEGAVHAYAALLSGRQVLFNKYGEAADPWTTLVGYFNGRKELGAMRRLLDDAVNAQKNMSGRGLVLQTLSGTPVHQCG